MIYENIHSTIYQVGIKTKVENFCYCLTNTSSILFHSLLYHIMSAKTNMSISNSKKSSMVTMHKTTSPTIFIKLDGVNYRVWSQILEMHIVGRKKKGYITRRKVAPAMAKDTLINSWLINSMTD